MSNNYKAVVLSPHLDDAVFSCGGLIQQLSRHGKVHVINIFTKFFDNSRGAAAPLTPARYEEEQAAAKLMGYSFDNLMEPDAFYRCKGMINIFKPLSEEDLRYLPVLKERLFSVLADINTRLFLVPLGVGWHADHQLTFLAMAQSPFKHKVIFYEDAPYCYVRHATLARLNCLNGISWPLSLTIQRWFEICYSYYHSGFVQTLKPKWIIPFSILFTSYLLGRYMQGHAKASPHISIDTNPLLIDITKEAQGKLIASQCYESQARHLFTEEYLKINQPLHIIRNRYIEWYWKLSDSPAKIMD